LGRLNREILVNSPLSRVWRVLEKHLEHPEISDSHQGSGSIEEVRGEALSVQRSGVGTRSRWLYKYKGKPFTWDDVVTRWDPMNRISWKTTSGWQMEDSFMLREDDRKTRLTYEMSYHLPYGPLGWLYGKIILEPRMRNHLDDVMERIKRLSENPLGPS
jgi:uncharacterized membrane protein